MLNVGIIGCGGIGGQHAYAYSQIEDVNLVALIDFDIKKAEALVEKYGGKAYKSIDDVPEKLDLVSVVTPPAAHYPVVMDLLDRGIPVFCEKPITTDVEQAKELLKKSKETGIQVGLGFKMRYEPVFAKAKELVGELGELFGLSVAKNQPFSEDHRSEWIKNTGCMYELSVHDYDLINWIMDAEPVSVNADLRYSETWVREDKAFLDVEYSNGVRAQLMSSYSKDSAWAPNDITMVFTGERGTMRVLIIIPAYNEAESIEKVVDNIVENFPQYDYIVINDGSSDTTRDVCRERGYQYLNLSINLGIGGAVQTGYKYAKDMGYDVAIQIDGDGQHDISYLKDMLPILERDEADIVIGSRFISKEGFQSSVARRAGIKILSVLIFICTGRVVKDVTSGFRAVNKRFIDIYAKNYPIDYPEPEAIVSAVMHGGKIKEQPVIMHERENGISSINFIKSVYYMIKVTLAIIVCRISFGIRRDPANKKL